MSAARSGRRNAHRGARRAVELLAAFVILVLSTAGPAGPATAVPTLAVSCVDGVRVVHDCPSVPASVALAVQPTTITVTLTNTGSNPWRGGPVAAEIPVPHADVARPEGALPASPGARWRTIAGVVVARCEFPDLDATGIGAGRSVSCTLPRLGLADGTHDLWLTGFRGGLPDAGRRLGAAPAPTGVGPVATPRSLRFAVAGATIRVVSSPAIDPAAPPVQVVTGPASTVPAGGAHRPAAARAAPVVVLLLAAGAVAVVRRRRHSERHG